MISIQNHIFKTILIQLGKLINVHGVANFTFYDQTQQFKHLLTDETLVKAQIKLHKG